MDDSSTQPIAPPVHGRRRYRIVVAIDLSEYAPLVLEYALDQAARHDAPDLHFITVRETKLPLQDFRTGLFQLVTGGIDAFHRGTGDWRVRLHVRTGAPAEEIASLAADVLADLVVVGKFGRYDHDSGVIGSVAERLVALSPCPALVVGPTDYAIVAQPTCAACVALRARTHGEAIFCAAHCIDRPDDERSVQEIHPATVSDSLGASRPYGGGTAPRALARDPRPA